MKSILKWKRPETNVSETERWASLIGGGSLMAYGLARRDKVGFGLAVIAGALVYRGATGHSYAYEAFGVNRAERGPGKGTGHGLGVPYELGFRVDESVRIGKPRSEVFRFWRNLENLPLFMDNLESVKILDDKRSCWTVKGPVNVSWEAEIINEFQDQLIAWRSLPGSSVDTGGSVRFEDIPGGGTLISISLQYNPPAGTVGRTIARFIDKDPAVKIREDLQNLKELMETGTRSIPTSGRNGGKVKLQERQEEDGVTHSSEESFPASDAPSWTPEAL